MGGKLGKVKQDKDWWRAFLKKFKKMRLVSNFLYLRTVSFKKLNDIYTY